MSMGYIPKKRLYIKRQRKLRKKYKNFSCITCAKAIGCKYKTVCPFGVIMGNIKKCQYWKAREIEKTPYKPKKKENLRDVLRKFF